MVNGVGVSKSWQKKFFLEEKAQVHFKLKMRIRKREWHTQQELSLGDPVQ